MDHRIRRWQGKKLSKLSPEYLWPVRLIRIYTVFIYFEAAFQKLRHTGLDWMSADSISMIIMAAPFPTGLGTLIASHSSLAFASGFGILFIEAGAVLSLFSWRLAAIFIPGIALFHLLSYLTIGEDAYFFSYLIGFIFWIPFEKICEKKVSAIPLEPHIEARPSIN